MRMTGERTTRRLVVMDGQGGGIGVRLIRQLAGQMPEGWQLLCIGTNAMATANMLRAGAAQGATGENAACYQAGRADLILGPVGILAANGIQGEVSPRMAEAVSGAEAVKILIPSAHCGILVAGSEDCRLEDALNRAVSLALREMGQAASL